MRHFINIRGSFSYGLGKMSISEYNFGQKSLKVPFPAMFSVLPRSTPTIHSVQISTCSNGAKIISQDMEGIQTSVGIYVEAGPIFDPVNSPGLSYVMRWALTTSNFDSSLFQIDRTIRSDGVALEHLEIRKRFIGLRLDSRVDSWRNSVLHILAAIAAPRFPESDVERFRDTFDNLFEEKRWQQPREYAIDRLESVAYFKRSLGNPRHVHPYANDLCTHQQMLDHYCQFFRPSSITLAAVNVSHEELVSIYASAPFQHSSEAPHFARSAAPALVSMSDEAKQYVPSESHEYENRAKAMGSKPDMASEAIAAIGYNLSGGGMGNLSSFSVSLILFQLLQIQLADGFHYEYASNQQGIKAFFRPFTGTALIGSTIVSDPASSPKIAQNFINLFENMVISSIDIAKQRAKLYLKVSVLDSTRTYCDFLGSSVSIENPNPVHFMQIIESIDNVEVSDIIRAHEESVQAGPSLFAHGDIISFPSLCQLRANASAVVSTATKTP